MQFRSVLGPAFALGCLLLASCGGGGSGGGAPAPRFLVAAHGIADFPTYTEIEDVCPYDLGFSVFLEAGGVGWVSLEHWAFGSRIFEATWTQTVTSYEVRVANARVYALFQEDPYYHADVGWEDLKLTVRDDDGDGTAESGSATATLVCDWEIVLSSRHNEYDARFDLDDDVPPAVLTFGNDDGTEPLYPANDTLVVRSDSPLLAESIPGGAAVLVNGQPIVGTIVAPPPTSSPFVSGIAFDPESPLPFGAEITFDPGTIVDAFGQPASFDGAVYRTIDDPGPITDNPSFEHEGGWLDLQTASGSSLDPVDGQSVAVVSYGYPHGDRLIGYFDVREDATKLTVAVAVEDYLEYCDYSASNFWLQAPSGSQNLWPDVPDDPECGDFPYGCTIPWQRSHANLRALRGQRVLLIATPATYSECRVGETDTPLIDDIRIEYEDASAASAMR